MIHNCPYDTDPAVNAQLTEKFNGKKSLRTNFQKV